MNPPGVIGIGIDLVENRRIADMLRRWRRKFRDRVFLPAEQAYCEAGAIPAAHYAARFAVKEAVSKALRTGIGPQVRWLDIEVTRAGSGAPSVRLAGAARRLARAQGVREILISLSHTEHYAVAQAMILGQPPAPRRSPRPRSRS